MEAARWWAWSRRASARRASTEALRREHAGLALAGPHRDGRVPLQQLHRVEALGDRRLQLLVRDIHAQACELLAVPDPELRRQDDRVALADAASRLEALRRARVAGCPRASRDLEPGEPALGDGGLGGTAPATAPTACTYRAAALWQEGLSVLVETDLGAGHRKEVGARGASNPASTSRSQVSRSRFRARRPDRHACERRAFRAPRAPSCPPATGNPSPAGASRAEVDQR